MADEENKTRVALKTAATNFVTLVDEDDLKHLDDYIANQNVWFDSRLDEGNPNLPYYYRVLSRHVVAYRILP